MDRSLWLLLRLRTLGWLRRRASELGTLKGLLLVLAGSLVFLPMIVFTLLAPRMFIDAQVAAIARHGPLGMFIFCILNVLLSVGERAVYYSPAEVDFLFCGPFRPRHLLLYKIVGGLAASLSTAILTTLLFRLHAYSFLSAFVGLFLAIEMLVLFTLAVSLVAGTIGALAFDRRRKLLLAGVVILVAAAVVQMGEDALRLDPWAFVNRLEHSTPIRVVTAPFVPFIRAFTARRIWPDLLKWSAAALAIDALMVGLVLSLNTRYYEASASASARIYDRLRRARAGAVWTGEGKYRFGLPMLPRWGGAGPVAWRQLTTVTRSLERLVAPVVVFIMPAISMRFVSAGSGNEPALAVSALSILVSVTLFAPSLVGYDFRPDLGRIEALKTLPIAPSRLVIGQIATPVMLVTLGQCVAVVLVATIAPIDPRVLAGIIALSFPMNVLLLEVENLFSLWFPVRYVAANSVDFQMMGRQLLLMMAKTACAGVAAGLAGASAAAAYFLVGESWAAAGLAAWLTVAGFDLALVPVLARAFEQFDVARDRVD